MNKYELATLFILLEKWQRKFSRNPAVTNRTLVYILEDGAKLAGSKEEFSNLLRLSESESVVPPPPTVDGEKE